MNVKKIGLLCLALVLALGALGVTYAKWSDYLYIGGQVSTGYVDVDFHSQYDNDANDDDPKEAGHWNFDQATPVWVGERWDKDVADTSSTFDDGDETDPADDPDSATIIITHGYPCYNGSVCWDIVNNGQIPVKLWSVNLTQLKKANTETWAGAIPLNIGTWYFVDVETGNVDTTLDDDDDLSFILSAHDVDQIDPYTWVDPEKDTAYLDITVHVEQDSEQKTMYEFTICYDFAQWNESP